MGDVHDRLDGPLTELLLAQRVFFVGTAPSDPEGHLNLSPKGYDTFRVINETTVAYLDLTGSGVETIAHLRDNGRITLMFCVFEGPPKIVRLYGRGEVVLVHDPTYAELRPRFGEHTGARAIVRVALTRVQTACGYAVPQMRFESEREVLREYYDNKGEDGMAGYRREKNRASVDGLPGLDE